MPLSGECMSLDKNTNLFLALNPNVTLKQMSSCVSKCFIKFYCTSWFTKTHSEFFFFFFNQTANYKLSQKYKGKIFENDLKQEVMTSFSSVQFSCSVVSNYLRPHEPQHTRPPCPSPTPRVYPNSCPVSW